ncbi:MAG TPA: hypothetical protein VGN26_11290 [Armatimonadota bacterium]|jgi:hypothetical protein
MSQSEDRANAALRHERWRVWRACLAVAAPLVAFACWTGVYGSQRHRLVLHTVSATVTLESHTNPFVVTVPGKPPAPSRGLTPGRPQEDPDPYSSSDHVVPRTYASSEATSSLQDVTVPRYFTQEVFVVNGRSFVLTPRELRSGARRWPLPAGADVSVDVDSL